MDKEFVIKSEKGYLICHNNNDFTVEHNGSWSNSINRALKYSSVRTATDDIRGFKQKGSRPKFLSIVCLENNTIIPKWQRNAAMTKEEHAIFMPDKAKALLEDEPPDKETNTRAEHERHRNKCIREFPWGMFEVKPKRINLKTIEAEMDRNLFGLENAKRQVLRYIAAYNENPNAQIRPLLLVGAAGTGKSVFGKIIAKAMNKPFKVISMPAIGAAWQFTGTEKGWSNACCGIIVDSIIKEGDLPVFLFDEVDKAARDTYQYTSPQQGLLNLLDDSREKFADVFFEIPVNLKSAFFILTANSLSDCDEYMADRCLKIHVEGYKKPEERRIILTKYILPKLFKEYNLPASKYALSDEIISLILSASTDPNGGLRILQKQTENVLLELIYRKQQTSGSKSMNALLPVEAVKSVLSELYRSKSEKASGMGFGR
jgi:ATP-dependent Lon protease